SELVEFTPAGQFVSQFSIDASQGGAFGLAVSKVGGFLRLAAVEDVTNSVDVWTFNENPPPPAAPVVASPSVTPNSLSPAATSPGIAMGNGTAVSALVAALSDGDGGPALFARPFGRSAHRRHHGGRSGERRFPPSPGPLPPGPPYQPLFVQGGR